MYIKKTGSLLVVILSLLMCLPVYASEQLSVTLNSSTFHRGDIVNISGQTSTNNVSLQVNDSKNNVIFVEEPDVNNGEFNATFKLKSDANLGQYVITVNNNESIATRNFDVVNKSTGGGGGSSSTPTVPPSAISDKDIVRELVQTGQGKSVLSITVTKDNIEKIIKAKAEGKQAVEINLGNLDNGEGLTSTNIILPKEVLESAKGLGLNISTDRAVIELPESIVRLLGRGSGDVNIQIEDANQFDVQEQLGSMNVELVGDPLDINTNIVGKTTLRFPLSGIKFPEDADVRRKYLDGLSVFVSHSDGEKENIKGTIKYDANGLPVEIVITVNKFSTFAIIKQNPIEIALTIGNDSSRVNGKDVKLDAKPQLDSRASRVLIPVRFVSEILGAKVQWKESNKQVLILDRGQEIVLTVNEDKVFVNSQEQTIDCPPQIFANRTFVPLRFVSEALGAEVNYVQVNNQVNIKR